MDSENIDNDKIARAMLAMAETLRTQHPPKLKMAIKCAKGALKLECSDEMKAHCQLQLGKLLFFYTDHFEIARDNLHQSYEMFSLMGTFHVVRRLEALSLLCELYIHCLMWPVSDVVSLIRKELPYARQFSTFYYKLLFYFIEATKMDNVHAALDACDVALETVTENKPMELYFRITKHLISYQMLREEPANAEVIHIGAMIKELEQNPMMTFHLRNIKGFFMCTKLAFMLSEGQSRTSRSLLRKIQQEVSIAPSNDYPPLEGIRWMDATSMTVFACLMNVVVALVQCSYDRASKYHQLGVKHADEIVTKSTRTPQEFGVVRCVNQMKMASLELMALCNVMACRPERSLSNMHEMVIYSWRAGGQLLFNEYAPHIQYILGLLSNYLQKHESAENHFLSALKMVEENRGSKNLTALLQINLALTYLNQLKMGEYYSVAEHLSAARIADCSAMVKNNVKFLNTFFFFLNQKSNDCKLLLQELLNEAKAEDFFRLHGLALLLLSVMMPVDQTSVKPTVDWSKRFNDHAVVLWSHKIYAEMLRSKGEDTNEIMQDIEISNHALSVDNLTQLIESLPAANLLQWFEGDPQSYLPKDDFMI